MGAPVRSDDGKPSKVSLKSESPKNAPPKDPPRDVGAAPSIRASETPVLPWKTKPRGGVFEGDVAAAELCSWLAVAPEQIPEPAVPSSKASTSSGRLMRCVAMAAAVAGIGGYLWGWETSTKIPELTPASGQAGDLPKLSTSVESLKTLSRDLGPAAAIGPAPVDTRGTANPVSSVDATQWLQTVSPSVDPPPPVVAEDASLIAARMRDRMRAGVELVTYGEIATARKIFELVAEAGEAAGAFALAETYDPLELGGLRLAEGIKPDVALARTWYERARSLGSLDARDRLSRLAQLPQ
jgi:hypothetical protein